MKFTFVGCNPSAPWWKQAWSDARALRGDNVGCIGISECGKVAKFQERGVDTFTVKVA